MNSNRTNATGRNADKLIHSSGKDFIRVNARKNQEVFNTDRKKTKYSSALGQYNTHGKSNRIAHGTIDVTKTMDKMSHYELSPRHLGGG